MPEFSIVICTYNPDERLLHRCLQAVSRLDLADTSIEVLLVDNNSRTPVAEMPVVTAFSGLPLQHIFVKEQGVKHARIAAIAAATGDHIVYFDYDNEAERDYLQALKKLHMQYPQVAAWGPGHVSVDFLDGVDDKIEAHARVAFQERHETREQFAREPEWQACYPFGTGLCTRATLLKDYIRLAKEGRYTMYGRKGKSLSSGEDTQMVLHCIREGSAAGVSPQLKITHMIPASRANTKYLQRLAYGTSLCYETCLVQVFPERREQLRMLPPSKFVRQAFKRTLKARFSTDPHRFFALAQFIGANAGVYIALGHDIPASIKRITKYLELE